MKIFLLLRFQDNIAAFQTQTLH